jgi:hypothetical protein
VMGPRTTTHGKTSLLFGNCDREASGGTTRDEGYLTEAQSTMEGRRRQCIEARAIL